MEHKFFLIQSKVKKKWYVYSTLDRLTPIIPEGVFSSDGYIECKDEADRRNEIIEKENKKQIDLF